MSPSPNIVFVVGHDTCGKSWNESEYLEYPYHTETTLQWWGSKFSYKLLTSAKLVKKPILAVQNSSKKLFKFSKNKRSTSDLYYLDFFQVAFNHSNQKYFKMGANTNLKHKKCFLNLQFCNAQLESLVPNCEFFKCAIPGLFHLFLFFFK